MITNKTSSGFAELGVAPRLIEILDRNKITTPTPIQTQSIPIAIQGKDLMGIAQTGTGKTFAFGLPMIQRLAQDPGRKGLIIVPTRELAIQVDENLRLVGSALKLKTAVLIGGDSMSRQMKMLRMNPHIIIATPGRLNDHLENSKLDLSVVSILVLDEADRMLDMGFAPQIKKILTRVPKQRQTMLFSATMPAAIVQIANSYMHMPLRVEVAPAGTAAALVTQELYFLHRNDKNEMLKTVLNEYKGSALVFTRTKYKAKDVARAIRNLGHTATEIHSNRSLGQRKEALTGFKVGKFRVLVATDIAARGIDVTGIQIVLNYDLPDNPEDYIHRIGRTGRAGMTGHAISFATHDQRMEVRSIERLLKKPLAITKTPALPNSGMPTPEDFKPEPRGRGGRRDGGRPSRFGRSNTSGGYQDRGPRREFKPRSDYKTVSESGASRTSEAAPSRSASRPPYVGKPFERKSYDGKPFEGKPKNSRGGFSKFSKGRPRDDFKKPKPGLSSGAGYFMKRSES